jgi:hypothetical protein
VSALQQRPVWADTHQFTGVALNCLTGRGFFEETEFGSEVYKNTELSRLTSAKHPTTLKDTIGLACVKSVRLHRATWLMDAQG